MTSGVPIPLPLTASVATWVGEFFTGRRPRRDGITVKQLHVRDDVGDPHLDHLVTRN